jgi:hypothetical protein
MCRSIFMFRYLQSQLSISSSHVYRLQYLSPYYPDILKIFLIGDILGGATVLFPNISVNFNEINTVL